GIRDFHVTGVQTCALPIFLGVVGVTGGEIKGDVFDSPDETKSRAPAFYGKLGVDRQLNDDLRVRLTGSAYTTSSSASNTLYGGRSEERRVGKEGRPRGTRD